MDSGIRVLSVDPEKSKSKSIDKENHFQRFNPLRHEVDSIRAAGAGKMVICERPPESFISLSGP
jgi:hypothetical protein